MRKLGACVVVEGVQTSRIEPLEVGVQGIHEDGEGQVSLELRRRPGEDEVPAQIRADGELAEEASLADPRFTRQLEHARMASIHFVQGPLEGTELVGPPYEMSSQYRHAHVRVLE
jgi:hypothetical protein